jgi:hypothetical protein
MKRWSILLIVTALVTWVSFAPARQHSHTKEEIGVVHFTISTNRPETQDAFNNAMALLYSFAYADAFRAFNEITLTDHQCAMAYWGIAQSMFHPVWEEVPTAENVTIAQDAIRMAKRVGIKTEREKDYIEAIQIMFSNTGNTEYPDRVLEYQKAMEKMYQKYPDDQEAAILYALTLDATAPKTDKSYAQQRKAGQILLKIFDEQPNHPGVVHYIIHAYDYPPLAGLALNAARKYANIAPAVPHALHMPSHIFVRLGLWEDNIATNIASARTALELAHKTNPTYSSFDALHAWDYMMYGFLQLGKDMEARGVLDTVKAIHKIDRANFAAAYALSAIPARYALERHDWKSAAALTSQPIEFPWERFPFFTALTWYAKGMGAAKTGDTVAARAAIEKLQSLCEASLKAKEPYWASQVDILRGSVHAWTLHAEGKNDDALKAMRSVADHEDATGKHAVTPGSLIPQRELLGDLLLELDRPNEALVEFESSFITTPNRFNGIAGAALAAERSGDRGKARKYYSALLDLTRSGGSSRPQVEQARTFLARNQ